MNKFQENILMQLEYFDNALKNIKTQKPIFDTQLSTITTISDKKQKPISPSESKLLETLLQAPSTDVAQKALDKNETSAKNIIPETTFKESGFVSPTEDDQKETATQDFLSELSGIRDNKTETQSSGQESDIVSNNIKDTSTTLSKEELTKIDEFKPESIDAELTAKKIPETIFSDRDDSIDTIESESTSENFNKNIDVDDKLNHEEMLFKTSKKSKTLRYSQPTKSKVLIAGIFAIIGGLILFTYYINNDRVLSLYEKGIKTMLPVASNYADRKANTNLAEKLFQEAFLQNPEQLNKDILQRYAQAYMDNGFYQKAFYKLFAETTPKVSFPEAKILFLSTAQKHQFKDQYQRKFTIKTPGAYILEYQKQGKPTVATMLALAKFHSNPSINFIKNDIDGQFNIELARSYIREILKQSPKNVAAKLTETDILIYNEKNYDKAMAICNEILADHPRSIATHAKMITIWLQQSQQQTVGIDSYLTNIITKYQYLTKHKLATKLPFTIQEQILALFQRLKNNQLIDKTITEVHFKQFLNQILSNKEFLEKHKDIENNKTTYELATMHYYLGYYISNIQNNPKQGLQYYKKAIQVEPNFYPAFMQLAILEKKARNFKTAENLFQKTIQSYQNFTNNNPNQKSNQITPIDIGEAYYHLGSIALLRYINVPEKSKQYQEYTEQLYPLLSTKLTYKQKQFYESLLKRALPFFDRALQLGLNNDNTKINNALYWKGLIYYLTNNDIRAIQSWIQIKESNPIIDLAIANALYHQRRYQSALNLYLQSNVLLKKYSEDISYSSYPQIKQQILLLLSNTENNIAATYTYLNKGPTKDSLVYYYRAIEYHQQQNQINEIANSNLLTRSKKPLIDDWLPLNAFSTSG